MLIAKEGNSLITFGFASPVNIFKSFNNTLRRSSNPASISKPIINPRPLTALTPSVFFNALIILIGVFFSKEDTGFI